MAYPNCQPVQEPSLVTTGTVLQTALITALILLLFVACRTVYEHVRHQFARVTVVIIGAGPIGLLSALVAIQNLKVNRVILFEEKSRKELLSRPQQVAFNATTVRFVKSVGIDLDSIEGCWHNKCFLTPIAVFQEYLLDRIYNSAANVEIKLNCKFSKECLKKLDDIPCRLLAIVCDGSQGRSSTLLGLSDEFTQHSCRSYGAVATLERNNASSYPVPEIHVHNLTFDLNAYGNHTSMGRNDEGFHFKIFGTNRHRYMALAVARNESSLLKSLKSSLDQSVMRNIFQICYNSYKHSNEPQMTEKQALRQLKFSPRLFEVKLFQRLESVMYVEDGDVFVITEGEAARYSNFYSGLDINLSIKGLAALDKFIHLAASARVEKDILDTLTFKFHHHTRVCTDFIKNGMTETMFT